MFLFDRIHELFAAMSAQGQPEPFLQAFGRPDLNFESLAELEREASWTFDRIGTLNTSSRFVLEPDTVRAMVSVLSSRPASLLSCLEVLRIPWLSAWFEWDEGVRMGALREVSPESWAPFEGGPIVLPGKVGLQVETDASGRRGVFRTAWPNTVVLEGRPGEYDLVCTSAPDVHFDFDNPKGYLVLGQRGDGTFQEIANLEHLVEKSVTAIGAVDSPENLAAMARLSSHFQVVFDFAAMQRCVDITLIRSGVAPGDERPEVLAHLEDASREQMSFFARDVIAEILPFLSMMMLMTAVGGVERRPSNLAQLNKQRARRRLQPRLEHEIVRVRLDRAQRAALNASGVSGSGLGVHRRPHMVGGHFVRRGDKIFWRRGHMRGLAGTMAPGRTYVVSGAPPIETVPSRPGKV